MTSSSLPPSTTRNLWHNAIGICRFENVETNADSVYIFTIWLLSFPGARIDKSVMIRDRYRLYGLLVYGLYAAPNVVFETRSA